MNKLLLLDEEKEEGNVTKRCQLCKERKPLSEFYARLTLKGGFFHDCKKCISIITKYNRRKNSPKKTEDLRRYQKNYVKKNKEKIKKTL